MLPFLYEMLADTRLWITICIAVLTVLPRLCSLFKRRAVNQRVKQFCTWLGENSSSSPVKNLHGKNILAIVNPNGGNRTAVDTYHRILEPMCKAADVPVKLVTTMHAGHAQEIAREAASTSPNTIIVCLSGDGMLHDALVGLIDDKQHMRLPIAVVPCGSSNGFSKSIYNSVEPFEAIESILLGSEHSANLISAKQIVHKSSITGSQSELGPEYDLVGLSHGVVVDANTLTEVKLRWMNKLPFGGTLKDLLSALFLIGQMKLHHVKIQIQPCSLTAEDRKERCYTDPTAHGNSFREKLDRSDAPPGADPQLDWYKFEDDVCWCEVINIPWLSYDMQVAPGKKLDGGSMDFIVSRGHSKWQVLKSFLKVESGKHVHDPWIERYKVSQVAITPLPGNTFNMSGERLGFEAAAAHQTVVATCLDGHARLWYRDATL